MDLPSRPYKNYELMVIVIFNLFSYFLEICCNFAKLAHIVEGCAINN